MKICDMSDADLRKLVIKINNSRPIDWEAERRHIARGCLIWTLERLRYKKARYFDVELERAREAVSRPLKVIEVER